MLRKYDGTFSFILLRIGDDVIYEDGRIGTIENIQLRPNGVSDPRLICRLQVKMATSQIAATSDKFVPVPGFPYLEID